MNILVMGASGYIGSHLVPALVARSHTVRAASRDADSLRYRQWDRIELCSADILKPETLGPALVGIDLAFYLVHSMGSGADFAEKDRRGARNFSLAAREAGVRRIIYLGGIQPPGGESAHLRSRRETGEMLRVGGVPVTELRAGIVVGPGSAAFEVVRDLVNHLPVMTTPRWVRSRSQPIALADLIAYLIGTAECDATAGGTFDVGGPELLSYAQLLQQFAAVTGKRCLIIPLPVLTPRLSSYWLDFVTSVPATIVRPLIDGLRHDLPARDAGIRALLPIPLKTYGESIVAALRDEREAPLPVRWAEGALAFRGYNPDVSFYAKGASTETVVNAPASRVWEVVSGIGGRRGYYYADILWSLRGALDRMVGGVGMRRGRRDPRSCRVGDAVDFWRVAAVVPGERLTLVAEMKLPGSATLELEVLPLDGATTRLVTTARFHPRGLPGLLYWYGLLPIHNAIFAGMPRAIGRKAERLAAARS